MVAADAASIAKAIRGNKVPSSEVPPPQPKNYVQTVQELRKARDPPQRAVGGPLDTHPLNIPRHTEPIGKVYLGKFREHV